MQFKSFMENLKTEEKTIEVTMKSGHKFTAPIKVSHKDWHIVKHPVSGKQYRVDHKGNTLEEEVESIEEAMSPQQKSDFDRMMAGAMSRAAYNAKWKKPLKSDSKVIYGKNVKEETDLEEQAPVAPSLVKHRIGVTVSEPDHPMVSKRKEKQLKFVRVTHSDDKEGARKVGEKHFAKKGYKVHDSHHAGMVNEESNIEEGYVVRYNNPKSEKHGSEKHFDNQASAQKHADRGNSVDKIGGKYTVHKTNEKGHDIKEEIELDEAVESGNKGYGYHGQHESDVADKKYSAMHAKVKKVAGEAGHLRDAKKPNVMVKHYLDSRHGRHLAGNEHDHEYIKKDFGKFKKAYKESDFAKESVGFDEAGNLMAEKLTYAQFMEQLLEYTPGPGGVTRVQGRSYGAQYHDPEGDDDADDKPKKKAESAVKRGRGRPAGSKSGANQKVTSGKSYGGIATHSLHLPSSNR